MPLVGRAKYKVRNGIVRVSKLIKKVAILILNTKVFISLF